MNTKPVHINYDGTDVELSILNLSPKHIEQLKKSLPGILEDRSKTSENVMRDMVNSTTTARSSYVVLASGNESIYVHACNNEDVMEKVSNLPIDLIINLIESFVEGNTKDWWKSKTIWVNILSTACFAALYFGVDLAGYLEIYFLLLPAITSIINVILRNTSNTKISTKIA